MDTLTHHYYRSIFFKKDFNKYFWNPEESWLHAKMLPFTKYRLDAWHLFKSAMIIFQASAIITAWIETPLFNVWWFYLSFFILLGIVWNGTFNLFYNHILR